MNKTIPFASILLSSALLATPALAGEIDCNGRMGRAAIDGDLRVPAGKRCTLDGTRIDGNIQLEQGSAVRVDGVDVDGDIQVFSNRGAIRVSRNRVDGNLQCKENRNRPSGGNNRVRGNKEDQCARL